MDIYRSIYALARIIIGSMFIYTGIIHGLDPHGFAQAVRAYQVLPPWSVNIFALILPGIELLAGLTIATGIFIRGGALAAAGMLFAFSIALLAGLNRGLDISCGCFTTSPEAERISWLFLVRDIALLIVALFILQHPLLASKTRPARPKSFTARLLVPALTALAVAGIFLFQALTRDPCQGLTLEGITRHRAYPSAAILAKRPVAGLCEVLLQTGSQVIPLYIGENFLISGDLYRERMNITGEGFTRLRSRYFMSIRGEADQAVAIGRRPRGIIRHTLYLFASPTCPHCEEVLAHISPILDETQTDLKVLFMAKGQARHLAIEAVCRGVDLETYLSKRWMTGGEDAACSTGAARVTHSNDIARRLGITRVPTFFTEDGIMLVGVQLPELRSLLGAAPLR